MIAIIPARGGSKGLPGKNIRTLAGLPLLAHSILMAKMCPEIKKIVVSTDDEKIAEVAKKFGAEVPGLRPAELAQDDTPMWPVIQHALRECEPHDYVLLLDPTSPGRTPQDVAGALAKLQENRQATGIIGVSRPEFSPIWHTVVEEKGWMADFVDGAKYTRRQDVPVVFRINASLYIWRTDFVKACTGDWRTEGKHLLYEIPEARAIHIDDLFEFQKAEILVKEGLIKFPWLQ